MLSHVTCFANCSSLAPAAGTSLRAKGLLSPYTAASAQEILRPIEAPPANRKASSTQEARYCTSTSFKSACFSFRTSRYLAMYFLRDSSISSSPNNGATASVAKSGTKLLKMVTFVWNATNSVSSESLSEIPRIIEWRILMLHSFTSCRTLNGCPALYFESIHSCADWLMAACFPSPSLCATYSSMIGRTQLCSLKLAASAMQGGSTAASPLDQNAPLSRKRPKNPSGPVRVTSPASNFTQMLSSPSTTFA
mmetsp:Transcript_67411/g.119171  ORF Transcript_67411/g.119171 Transcript_67411/m.119171 type:complete len:251 (+) Transcript_67411:499-1251(+)